MKKTLFLLLFVPVVSFGQIDDLLKKVEEKVNTTISGVLKPLPLSQQEIAAGLKEALNKGIEKQVSTLTKTDGFYRNELVKILLPEELQKVDKALRKIGMSKLADQGLLAMNRAAEDAVKTSTPIFVDAVKQMSFTDAKNILLGDERSATTYLQTSTTKPLYDKFNPVIKNSFTKVGADKIWANIIKRYNAIPLVEKVNPDLTDYTTNKALDGVFKMISVEEKNIRTNFNSRTTDLLKKVFALQDKK